VIDRSMFSIKEELKITTHLNIHNDLLRLRAHFAHLIVPFLVFDTTYVMITGFCTTFFVSFATYSPVEIRKKK